MKLGTYGGEKSVGYSSHGKGTGNNCSRITRIYRIKTGNKIQGNKIQNWHGLHGFTRIKAGRQGANTRNKNKIQQ